MKNKIAWTLVMVTIVVIILSIISPVVSFWRKVTGGLSPWYAFYDLLVDLLGVDRAIIVIEWIEWVESAPQPNA